MSDIYSVRIEYGPYTHRETVSAEDEEQAIAKAWGRLRRRGLLTLPMASASARAERVESTDE